MMARSLKLPFYEASTDEIDLEEWTFNGASTRESTHCYHDYPARMIPQIAAKLLDTFGLNARSLFDPYCGTGTSLVEGLIRGLNVAGTDINPLARLIASAKTTLLDIKRLREEILTFENSYSKYDSESSVIDLKVSININLDFWFKPEAAAKLTFIKEYISNIADENCRRFFQVAFSETARESSNTRISEFKLLRKRGVELEQFQPNVFGIMSLKLKRNLDGLKRFSELIPEDRAKPIAKIYDFNTVEGIPKEQISPESIDIVITSPPYGDSGTTVAYGQYSRLSAAWLDLPDPASIDRKLMGGKRAVTIQVLPCRQLMQALEAISGASEKRALEVAAFYNDLFKSIENISKVVKTGGFVCYVVGNRKVRGVVLPTDLAIREFFSHLGFTYINTFCLQIPNKRIPLRNSPTNESGVTDDTMTKESIVVLMKPHFVS